MEWYLAFAFQYLVVEVGTGKHTLCVEAIAAATSENVQVDPCENLRWQSLRASISQVTLKNFSLMLYKLGAELKRCFFFGSVVDSYGGNLEGRKCSSFKAAMHDWHKGRSHDVGTIAVCISQSRRPLIYVQRLGRGSCNRAVGSRALFVRERQSQHRGHPQFGDVISANRRH